MKELTGAFLMGWFFGGSTMLIVMTVMDLINRSDKK